MIEAILNFLCGLSGWSWLFLYIGGALVSMIVCCIIFADERDAEPACVFLPMLWPVLLPLLMFCAAVFGIYLACRQIGLFIRDNW